LGFLRFIVRQDFLGRVSALTRSLETAINRLDKLTSGLMIISLNSNLASTLSEELRAKNRDQGQSGVQKEYIARCLGRFPE
jgi:23S rRNA-/tRNA-specific pseudouridylate synthase